MDDEEAICDVVGMMLRRRGYAVTVVGDGRDAVTAYGDAIARGIPYDLVVLDLAVPGGVGAREAIRLLRQLDPDVRALVSSGHSEDPVMADPAAHGFAGVVPKPYEIAELVAALERAMA
jgi:CheY-like chemotaxis protein